MGMMAIIAAARAFRARARRRPPAGPGLLARAARAGQVTVELLLVLPVFMALLFFIMELGNVGFQTILAHHCAYELARIGSLIAGPTGGGSGGGMGVANQKMNNVLKEMFPSDPGVLLNASLVPTLKDPQSGQMGEDLEVRLNYPVKLVFPISSYFLTGFPPNKTKKKMITVAVRMPVEKPYFQ